MAPTCFRHIGYGRKYSGIFLFCFSIILLNGIISAGAALEPSLRGTTSVSPHRIHIEDAMIVTQLPTSTSQQAQTYPGRRESEADWFLEFGEGARLVKVYPDSTLKELSRDFQSACDPAISFDASHILFAGKRTVGDDWNIYEMDIDGSNVRQITNGIGNCRSPGYQATLYTIVSSEPWYQLTFVGMDKKNSGAYGAGSTTNLYSCKLDGSEVRRLTYNLTDNMDPFIMSDGRLLFSSRHSSALDPEFAGRISLFGINIDGTDYALFQSDKGRLIKRMPCTITKGLAVFIESDRLRYDGAGSIGCTLLRRPLHSYRPITTESDGLFCSPSPLADGRILVSRRSSDDTDTYGIYCLDPSTGQCELVFDSPNYHDVQAKMIYPRPEPDGRSSVVTEKDPNGKLYCLDVYISDLDKPEWMPRGTVKRLRVLEGLPDKEASSGAKVPADSCDGATSVVKRRILGEIDVDEDGSFNFEIPANTPIELQTLDADGMALRSCGWIWARNHEPRGCIGCHEDGELTPENNLVDAVIRPSVKLNLPVERRRTVDFKRDVIPIISKKCIQCHGKSDSAFKIADESSTDSDAVTIYKNLLTAGSCPGHGKYIHPGRARTSPLIWHIFGRNTSRPWDDTFSKQKVLLMPPAEGQALTTDEKRTFVEWIDMGALQEGIPRSKELQQSKRDNGGSNQ
jgi:Tol biopolymer transport system component